MFVTHEEFGEGQIINSTEVLDEEGFIVSADVMFEHGIEAAVDAAALTVLEDEDKFAGLSPQFRAGAARARTRATRANYGVGGGARDKFSATGKLRFYQMPQKKETNEEVETPTNAKAHAKSEYSSWMRSEDAPSDDDSGNDNAVHSKAMDHLSGSKVPKAMHHAVAQHMTNMYHGVNEEVELVDEGKKKTNEEVEQVDEKLVGDQHKIDANKNGKIDGNDFEKLRDRKEVKESAETRVTPATASLRPSQNAASLIRQIMGEGRDVRKEAAIKEFESRKK